MHPDPGELVELVRVLIRKDHEEWDWKKVFIVYESASGKLTELAQWRNDTMMTVVTIHRDRRNGATKQWCVYTPTQRDNIETTTRQQRDNNVAAQRTPTQQHNDPAEQRRNGPMVEQRNDETMQLVHVNITVS